MTELIKNAWFGWHRYTDNGKVMALFLAALFFLWFSQSYFRQKQLLFYSTCMTVCCICPVTAAFLMSYQTRFYDYQWIWSAVPITVVTAFGGTVFLGKIWETYRGDKVWKAVLITCGCGAILLLCGSLGAPPWQEEQTDLRWDALQSAALQDAILSDGSVTQLSAEEQRKRILSALGAALETDGADRICLWAPREVMAEARSYSGEIILPYGRNLWDKALDAYSYDVTEDSVAEMYQWMCDTQELLPREYLPEALFPKQEEIEQWRQRGCVCMESARNRGVNRILLPGYLEEEYILWAEETLGVKAVALDGYYLFILD